MAVVQGIRERVHLPIYDSITLGPGERLGELLQGGMLRFFVNVQNKTKLETNLQAASLLPHYNTFEARAMRVVISDLAPVFPDENSRDVQPVTTQRLPVVDLNGAQLTVPGPGGVNVAVTADVRLGLDYIAELIAEAEKNEDLCAYLAPDAAEVTALSTALATIQAQNGEVELSLDDLWDMIDRLPDDRRPLQEQLAGGSGAGALTGKLIYNTVTTFYVGEKVMIQMPTWFFPAGAGVRSDSPNFSANGEPNPTATFKFAEPVTISKQQNFRVEIEIPESETLQEFRRIYGPLHIWVVLDGYMERDVQ